MASILEQFSQKDEQATTVKKQNIDRTDEPVIEQPKLNPETPPEPPGDPAPKPDPVPKPPATTQPTKPPGEITGRPNLGTGGFNPNSPTESSGVSAEIQASNQAAGEMILETYDFLKPALMAAYVDGDPEDYTMSKFKKAKMKKIFDLYMKTLSNPISPKAVFWSMVGFTIAGDVLEARAEKKKKEREAEEEKPSAKKAVRKASPPKKETPKPKPKPEPEPEPEPEDNYEEEQEAEDADNPNSYLSKRTRFDVDNDGFYCYPEGTYNQVSRNRLKKSQRIEKADPEIVEMWRNGLRNRAIKAELGLD